VFSLFICSFKSQRIVPVDGSRQCGVLLYFSDFAPDSYCSFAYSAFAAMKIGMSGSASFHKVRKS
jgi:hypothetical protein